MAKTFTAITKIGPGAFLHTWAAGTGPYRVIVDGIPKEESWVDTEYTAYGSSADEPPVVEVCEQGETVASESYPVGPVMQWFGHPEAYGYNIYLEGVLYDTVPESGRGYYRYSGFGTKQDGDLVTATILEIDRNGNETSSIAFKWLVFKYPQAPSVTYTYTQSTGVFEADAV